MTSLEQGGGTITTGEIHLQLVFSKSPFWHLTLVNQKEGADRLQ